MNHLEPLDFESAQTPSMYPFNKFKKILFKNLRCFFFSASEQIIDDTVVIALFW